MRRVRLAIFAVLVPALLTACSSNAEKTSAAVSKTSTTATAATTATTAPARTIHVRFTKEGPTPTLLAPVCSGGFCVTPASETGRVHGDVEGTHLTGGGTALVPGVSRLASSRIDVFIGTVKGCGSGSFVARGIEDLTGLDGTGVEEIAEGYGTGDLAKLTGTFRGSGGADSTGIHATLEGDFDCGK